MKKLSLFLVIAMLVSCIPCVSFAASNLPTNEKLAEWYIDEFVDLNGVTDDGGRPSEIVNSVDANSPLMSYGHQYGGATDGVQIRSINSTIKYAAKYIRGDESGHYQRIEVKNPSTLISAMNGGFTLSMWVLTEYNNYDRSSSLMKITNSAGNDKYFELNVITGAQGAANADGIVIDRKGDGSGVTYNGLNGDRRYSNNTWHHIVLSLGSSSEAVGNIKLYLDGEEVDLTLSSGNASVEAVSFPTNGVVMFAGEMWEWEETYMSNIAIYEGDMTPAEVAALYEETAWDRNMTYNVEVQKDGTLVKKSNLPSIPEGNITVTATISEEADASAANVYVINAATGEKVPFEFSLGSSGVLLSTANNYLAPGDYKAVVANKNQYVPFTVKDTGALTAVNAAIDAYVDDYSAIETAIFTTYADLFRIPGGAGSDYAYIANKTGLYDIFAAEAPFATVPDMLDAFKAAVEEQLINDAGDAIEAFLAAAEAENYDLVKEILLTTYNIAFGLPVEEGSDYYALAPEYQAEVFVEIADVDLEGLANAEALAAIRTKFDQICLEKRYAAFYAGLNDVAAGDMEATLTGNVDKTGIELGEDLDEDLWADYQANKAAVNATLAASDISSSAKLASAFYGALAIEVLNGSTDRAEIKRVLSDYVTNVEGVSADLEANAANVAIELAGKTYADIDDLKAEVVLAIQAITEGSGSVGGAVPKPSVNRIPGGNTFGFVVNSKEPGFTVEDTEDEKEEKPAEVKGFTDLQGYEWAAEYINKLADLGVVNGKSANSFAPGDKVTRFEYVAMLSRAYKLDGEAELPFTDVAADHWAYTAVKGAYALGIVGGVDEFTFDGNASITREAMATIVYRFLKAEPANAETVAEYADNAEISAWAVDAVYKMQELGLMNGKDGNAFDPKGLATRAETAALICRLIDSYNE